MGTPIRASAGWLARQARGLRPDRNPLRRPADRAEIAVIAGLVALFLAGAPLTALAAGHWARASGLAAARAQQAARRQIAAVVLQNAPGPGYGPYAVAVVRARWATPSGPRTGLITASYPALAGSTVRVWTDRSGRLTARPGS